MHSVFTIQMFSLESCPSARITHFVDVQRVSVLPGRASDVWAAMVRLLCGEVTKVKEVIRKVK